MNRLALLLCCVSLIAGAQEPTAPAQDDSCLATEEDEAGDSQVLGAPRLSIDGETRALVDVEFQGLEHLAEARVRELARIPARGPLSPERAAVILERLARTGLFTRVTPTVRLSGGSAPVLVVALEEQPYVAHVDIVGLHAEEQRDVRADLFRRPPSSLESADAAPPRACPAPNPPRELLAHFEKGQFHPGLVWRGLPAALERALDELQDEGHLLASLDATLAPDGRLEVRVDKGKVEAVDVRGVDEDVAKRVREVLGIQPGDVLLRGDLRRAAKRVEVEMPFLSLWDVETRPSPLTRFKEVREEGGGRRYQPVTEAERRERKKQGEEDAGLSWGRLAEGWSREPEDAITLEGRRVVVHVRPRGPSFDADVLPMHTQVTGFAPGVSGSLKLWDARDRAHLLLDAALLIPLRWGGQRIPDDPEQTALQRRLHWLVGAKLQVPLARLAEVGVQVHDFTDTHDRWRLGDLDSYLYSALLNHPDREYFRRGGYTAFATWRFRTQWLAGAEYRRDRYDSLVSFTPPFSLFRRDSAPFPNAPVDEGRMASVVGRLEYASDAARAEGVGSLFRNPELSLPRHDWEWPEHTAVRSLLTVEVGSPFLGGDARFRFWKVVSDNVLYLSTGHDTGLRVRVRAAGGGGLPSQRREALGGWSALRGYGFKEFRGDASVLASAEYRWGFVGALTDVGTVHRDEAGWMEPRLGVGALVYFGDAARFALAWRTDERASLLPEARLLFVRPF